MKKMNVIITVFLALITFSGFGQSNSRTENPTGGLSEKERSAFLSNSNVDSRIKAVYNGTFKITEEQSTLDVMEKLSAANPEMVPFHFEVFNKAAKENLYLTEIFGENAVKMLRNNSEYVINSLSNDPDAMGLYVELIAYWAFAGESNLLVNLRGELNKKFSAGSNQQKAAIETLLTRCERRLNALRNDG